MIVVTAERNTARPVDRSASAIFSWGDPSDSAYRFVIWSPYETPNARTIGPTIITVIVTSQSVIPMIPNVIQTEHSVGRPEIMTTLIPWIGRIRPVCRTSQWNRKRTIATVTIPTGKICQNSLNEYSVTALVIGTGPVNVMLRLVSFQPFSSRNSSSLFWVLAIRAPIG